MELSLQWLEGEEESKAETQGSLTMTLTPNPLIKMPCKVLKTIKACSSLLPAPSNTKATAVASAVGAKLWDAMVRTSETCFTGRPKRWVPVAVL